MAVTDCLREKHFAQFSCCSLGLARRQRRSWTKASQSKARGVIALGPAPTGCLLSGKGGIGSLPGWAAIVSHGLCRFAGHSGQETGQLLSRHQGLPPRTVSAPSCFWPATKSKVALLATQQLNKLRKEVLRQGIRLYVERQLTRKMADECLNYLIGICIARLFFFLTAEKAR